MNVRDWQAVQAQGAAGTLMRLGHRRLSFLRGADARRRPDLQRVVSREWKIDAVSCGSLGEAVQVLPAGGQSGRSLRASRPTLLIVDDQPGNVQALYHALKQDYQLLVATNGFQAIELCRSAKPDMVLLDVVMPGMDGYAVCKRLKADDTTCRIPIIFITGSTTTWDESQCLEAGAVDFISKPVNPSVLQSRVRTHLTLKHQADRLRHSSEELANAQRLGKVGSWHWDLLADQFDMSQQLRSMLDVEQLSGSLQIQRARAQFASVSWWRGLRALARAKAGESTENIELDHCRSDGTMGHLLCNMEAMTSAAGEVIAVSCTLLDITDRMRVEQLRIEKEAAELASEHKDRFLSSMSHELRTPLNAVLGFAQLLSFEPSIQSNRGLQSKVGHILHAGNHLLSMVAEILDLACIDAGKIALTMTSVDAVQAMRDALEMTAPEAQSRNLWVGPTFGEGAHWVQADQRRLHQILLNLLSNAIKYNRHGGEIRLSVRSMAREVQFAISDTGKGLSSEQVRHLFEPFNRLGSENSSTQGTGIGLVLCRHLAEAMGGRIEVSSVPGAGSTFTLCLPQWLPPDIRLSNENA
ncbi:ATP-binding protein [Aquabacterium sp.]|uniref:ATP-binding protein n=1 Tax=Aquabacterium sp. TaxID=1872578 RepID=UPI0024893CB2|nr:ATP-binding protein [Aquabacterium sp.]MDI1257804.1 ATP-binding protein [Aquabacterium sp.]